MPSSLVGRTSRCEGEKPRAVASDPGRMGVRCLRRDCTGSFLVKYARTEKDKGGDGVLEGPDETWCNPNRRRIVLVESNWTIPSLTSHPFLYPLPRCFLLPCWLRFLYAAVLRCSLAKRRRGCCAGVGAVVLSLSTPVSIPHVLAQVVLVATQLERRERSRHICVPYKKTNQVNMKAAHREGIKDHDRI